MSKFTIILALVQLVSQLVFLSAFKTVYFKQSSLTSLIKHNRYFRNRAAAVSSSIRTSDLVEAFFKRENKKKETQKLAIAGRSVLSQLKLPSGKDEAWRYTNMKRLFEPFYSVGEPSNYHSDVKVSLENAVDTSCKESCLVFVDGIYSPALSCTTAVPVESVDFFSLSVDEPGSCGKGADVLSAVFSDNVLYYVPDKTELPRNSYASDALTAINMASCENVAVLRVRKGADVSVPMQVVFYSTQGHRSTVVHTRFVVIAEDDSKFSFKQTFIGKHAFTFA